MNQIMNNETEIKSLIMRGHQILIITLNLILIIHVLGNSGIFLSSIKFNEIYVPCTYQEQ